MATTNVGWFYINGPSRFSEVGLYREIYVVISAIIKLSFGSAAHKNTMYIVLKINMISISYYFTICFAYFNYVIDEHEHLSNESQRYAAQSTEFRVFVAWYTRSGHAIFATLLLPDAYKCRVSWSTRRVEGSHRREEILLFCSACGAQRQRWEETELLWNWCGTDRTEVMVWWGCMMAVMCVCVCVTRRVQRGCGA